MSERTPTAELAGRARGAVTFVDPVTARLLTALAAALEDTAAERDRAHATLREVRKALRANLTAWLTVQPHLDRAPYPDDDRWTPWTRWGSRAADRAMHAERLARERLENP